MLHVYINGELCDIDITKKDILFKRVLLDPAKLNTEDIQRSYQIQLPKSEKNNRIFGFRNVEEVKGKFNGAFPAEVYINDVRILEGHFVLSKITEDAYIGNVGVLYQKSIKDIFGDRAMNQAGDWIINDFGAFKESIERYNAREDVPECIFPAVLYGLLPKVKRTYDNKYTDKDMWDNTVRLGMDDLMPSVNCLQMIKNIFDKEGYSIGGSAFGDRRLNELYVSYKNPVDYEPEWNYQKNGVIDLSVAYCNYSKFPIEKANYSIEPTIVHSNADINMYVTEIQSSVNSIVTINKDEGNNVIKTDVNVGGDTYTRHGIIVPKSGVYKIFFETNIELNTTKDDLTRAYVGDNWRYIWGSERYSTYFGNMNYEVKLLRDKGEGDFNLERQTVDRRYYSPTINQNRDFNIENPNNFPKYFPVSGKTMFIDPEQNSNLVCGIAFGMEENGVQFDGSDSSRRKCNPIVIKGGLSWNHENTNFTTAAARSDGYYRAIVNWLDNVIYLTSSKFKVECDLKEGIASMSDKYTAGGSVEVLVWLEKGERLTIADCSYYKTDKKGTTGHTTTARVIIEPYKRDEKWLADYLDGNGETVGVKIPYDKDNNDFFENKLNLTTFLPSDEKIDDWLDNFCKAFNLTLTQTGEKNFELNIKQTRQASLLSVIDVQAYQQHRTNSDLNLPPAYVLGFTLDDAEEGYEKDTNNPKGGGGKYETGVERGSNIEQNSNFSYCWYKQLYDSKAKELAELPVISDHEVWRLDDTRDYEEMQQKWFVNKRQRFWYRDSAIKLPGLGTGATLLATVRNELPGYSILDYQDKPLSILDNFFSLFINGDNSYTEIECFLTPEEYQRLPYSMVRFNGDLYYPAEINNYDPHGNRKASLKLIRKL